MAQGAVELIGQISGHGFGEQSTNVKVAGAGSDACLCKTEARVPHLEDKR
jgi:hypothetical protein